MRRVAALYVDLLGVYPKISGVDPWGFASRSGDQLGLFGESRDARAYDGPDPIVAHPPCGPWGRFYWNYKGGEGDKSCGPRAIEQARSFGGVVEHPAQSNLWKEIDLPRPGDPSDAFGGWTLEVNQCDFGHLARKATWLYIVGCSPGDVPRLPPHRAHTHVMVRLLRNGDDLPEVPKRVRHLTPSDFAAWLVVLARLCGRQR